MCVKVWNARGLVSEIARLVCAGIRRISVAFNMRRGRERRRGSLVCGDAMDFAHHVSYLSCIIALHTVPRYF